MGISFNTIPLTPVFGAEIVDVDLSADTGQDLFSLIYQAFLDYQVLVFRRQNMSSADHVRFARLFGEVQVHVMNQYHADSHPELYLLTNLDKKNLKFTTDFRSVYATVLEKWLGAPTEEILGGRYPTIPLLT